MMMAEERRIAADPKYRSPARVLRRLSAGNVVYEVPGAPRGNWDRFAIRNVGLAVQRRMFREFNGDAAKIRVASAEEVARVLEMKLEGTSEPEYRAFEDLALVLALIPSLPEWSGTEKQKVVQIIRAKTDPNESHYARLLKQHQKLRAAIIKLGEPAAPL